MKNLFLSLLLTLCMATNVFAFADQTNATTLFDTESMTSGSAEESAGVKVRHNVGFATLLVTEDIAGGAGDVDIYAEYSQNNTAPWSRVQISNMSGTLTTEGNIATAFGNESDARIVFTVRMGNWIRIVFDPDANSTIDATLIFLEDR